MLKSFCADNFKALNSFSLELNPITILIGDNSSGKSSVLQAIAFLKSCCLDSASLYLKNRSLSVSELCSKFSTKKVMTFRLIFDFGLGQDVRWDIVFFIEKANEKLELLSETVYCGETVLLQYGDKTDCSRYNALEKKYDPIMKASYKFSLLSLLDNEKDRQKYPVLLSIKHFFEETEPLDLLSPKDMRRSTRGSENTIGESGEKLPAFIKGLTSEDKADLTKTLHNIFPQISEIHARVDGRQKWTYLQVNETYNGKKCLISSSNVSDGVLRLIALFSVKYMKKSGGIILLDEIEDGINSGNIEKLMAALQDTCKKNQQQLLATTHNTVLLDYVEAENIRYIARDKSGSAVSLNLFDYPEIRDKLSYMYPGEIILNASNQELSGFADSGRHQA